MPKTRQHYVPQVYLKAWKTRIINKNGDFNGIYSFTDNSCIGKGYSTKAVLWNSHLYTINFEYSFIGNSCPKILNDFSEMIHDYLQNGMEKPVYGKLGHTVIRAKHSIAKNIHKISDWDFFYSDGKKARKKSLISKINDLKSYILEDGFANLFETEWEQVLNEFINNVVSIPPLTPYSSERVVPYKSVINIVKFFFMMMCRNPCFDAMGTYKTVVDYSLVPLLQDLAKDETNESERQTFIKNESDLIIKGCWYSELYRLLYKHKGGFYHPMINKVCKECQLMLYDAKKSGISFITSDNPAVLNINNFLVENFNGFIFPLTPDYLLFVAKGDSEITHVGYKQVNINFVKTINNLIRINHFKTVVANKQDLNDFL